MINQINNRKNKLAMDDDEVKDECNDENPYKEF